MQAEPLTIERTYTASRSTIWGALTNPAELKQWYFDIPGFEPKVGCEFSFSAGPAGRKYLHQCKILEVVPLSKLSYTWGFPEYEGASVVTFELFDHGSGTRLKLTHAGIETFPKEVPDFALSNYKQGWTSFLESMLPNYLNQRVAPSEVADR